MANAKKATPKKAAKKKVAKAAPKKASTKTTTSTPNKEEAIKRSVEQSYSRKSGPGVFSMDDVLEVLKQKKEAADKEEVFVKKQKAKPAEVKVNKTPAAKKVLGVASLDDILGIGVAAPVNKTKVFDEKDVPAKWKKYYDSLVSLRKQFSEELDLHTNETLGKSARESSGDLSGYGQHMADSGTETYERDLALTMVSNEQEMLIEIEDAIERIFDGSYGVCEITGKEINKERLEAVPYARYSLEGQAEYEKGNRGKGAQRGNVFEEAGDEIPLFSTSDDGDE